MSADDSNGSPNQQKWKIFAPIAAAVGGLLVGLAAILAVFFPSSEKVVTIPGNIVPGAASPGHPNPTPTRSVTTEGETLGPDGQLLAQRVGRGLTNCVTSPSSIAHSKVSLDCKVANSKYSSISAKVASFESSDALAKFEIDETEKVGSMGPNANCLPGDGFNVKRQWSNGQGITIGWLYCYETTYQSFLVWTFENDSFLTDSDGEYFAVISWGHQESELRAWWDGIPV
ncbi:MULTISPECIES: hypothetical protein [Streptomyces]|uniref:Serine/threonine protein kinase n=1 Tax=Streptomyces doudnae TaxID=3075536 RepID=A0ABD5EYM7_9ACTN|nr:MULTISPECIES: hypothetical protein [unclassified Streptomyces]MDT0438684.1 hypothetical protein [Streptomyces sp. DSM 41981]MYQ62039.1 hypothetical protein [Streptomyces sp. SID4950]